MYVLLMTEFLIFCLLKLLANRGRSLFQSFYLGFLNLGSRPGCGREAEEKEEEAEGKTGRERERE